MLCNIILHKKHDLKVKKQELNELDTVFFLKLCYYDNVFFLATG